MKEPTFTGKDLKAVSAIYLLLNLKDDITKAKTELQETGQNFAKMLLSGKINKIISAVQNTAGHSSANDILVKYLNLLYRAINTRFPYLPLIQKRSVQVWEAFQIAIAKDAQTWKKIQQQTIAKGLGAEAILDEPKLLLPKLLGMKKKKKKEILNV